MRKSVLRISALALLASVAAIGFVGCTGSTDGGDAGEQSFDGSGFDGSDAGRMELVLRDEDMLVGESAGFYVQAFDEGDQPVPNLSIACDTEAGLALIEPADGQQLTDDGGIMSGRIGCEQVGSFRLGCRLPVGAGRRQFATIRCSGPIPSGFDGFPGAGGGGR